MTKLYGQYFPQVGSNRADLSIPLRKLNYYLHVYRF